MPIIRNTTDKDIKDVEYICRMTAGPGSIADERIGNIIAKTYATYYARTEQEVSFVLDDGGKAVGYILCAPDFKRFCKGYRKTEVKELFKIDFKSGFLAWFIPLAYLPFKNKYPAHMHIDLLDGYRGGGNGTTMVNTLLEKLKEMKITGVMLIVDNDNTGAQRFYSRNGFKKLISLFGGTVMAREI
jgi:ribosomal protein S18 acetylase RimI-like enzyme